VGTTSPVKEFEVRGDSAKIGLRNSTTDTGELGVTFCHDNSGSPVKTGIISKSNGNWGRSDLHFVVDSVSDGNAFNISADTKLQITNDGRGLSQFTAKAWVRFNGTGTVSILDSHNVSSLNDSGTGWCYVIYQNALGNGVNSCVVASCSNAANSYNRGIHTAPQSTANFSVMTFTTSSGSAIDVEMISAVAFGD
jgi:hypothetical protein